MVERRLYLLRAIILGMIAFSIYKRIPETVLHEIALFHAAWPCRPVL